MLNLENELATDNAIFNKHLKAVANQTISRALLLLQNILSENAPVIADILQESEPLYYPLILLGIDEIQARYTT